MMGTAHPRPDGPVCRPEGAATKDTVDEDVFGEKNSVYRAEIEIVENNLVELPEGFKLLPSMSVAGNIKSGKRTVMTFLMFPVIKTLETSFREP